MDEEDGDGGIDSGRYARPDCPHCQGSGYIAVDDGGAFPRQDLCGCVVEGRRRHACELRIRALFGHGGARMTFNAYDPGDSEGNADALAGARKYVEHWPQMRTDGLGFCLYGTWGCGKTHLATATLIALIKRYHGHNGRMLTAFALSVPEMLESKRKSFDAPGGQDLIARASTSHITLLDDIGAERRKAESGMNWVDEQLYLILNHRLTHDLPTIFTSNLKPRELSDCLDGRIFRRLRERTLAFWPVEANGKRPNPYADQAQLLRS